MLPFISIAVSPPSPENYFVKNQFPNVLGSFFLSFHLVQYLPRE